MADISKITLPSGSVYNFKDEQARNDIEAIESAIAGGVTFMGQTTTALTDGSTATSIIINDKTVTAVKGYLVVYNSKEFVFDGTKWIELGDLSLIGDLGWKDSASATYTPAGSVSQPTFTGTAADVSFTIADNTNGNYQPKGTVSAPTFTGNSLTSTGTFTPSGTINLSHDARPLSVQKVNGTATYTPEGRVSAPTISIAEHGGNAIINSITAVGSLPSLTATVANENLTLTWDAGTLPTKGSNTQVKTSDATYTASVPIFTGTGVRLATETFSIPTSATFSGDSGSIEVSGTPTGSVSQPTFTGTKTQISGSVTATGSVSKPTFTGTQATITVT